MLFIMFIGINAKKRTRKGRSDKDPSERTSGIWFRNLTRVAEKLRPS